MNGPMLQTAVESHSQAAAIVTVFLFHTGGCWEDAMPKGEQRGNKEAKKPKSDKPKSHVSEYKKSQGKGGHAMSAPGKKT